ncbi:MAG: diguanylate cyclase [Pseudomonadota bacterium]
MTWREPWRALRNLPVGIKLPATLVLVAVITALAISLLLSRLSRDLINERALLHLGHELETLARDMQGPGPPADGLEPFLERTRQRLSAQMGRPLRVALLLLGRDGRLTMAPADAPAPDGQVIQFMLAAPTGQMDYEQDDHHQVVVFRRLASGQVLGLAADMDQLVQTTLGYLRAYSWAATLVLSALVALFAVWLSRRELTEPLRRLTAEAERVAAGDLTPPEALGQRGDELGRLSRALASMAISTQAMVDAAQANQLRFQQLFTDSRDAAFIVNAAGRIEDINPAGLKIFGYDDRSQMQALNDTEALFSDPAERQAYLERLNAQGFVQDFPARLRRRGGRPFHALITATARADGQGRFGLVRDVTQAQAQQRALQESEERYRRLVENAPDIIYRWDIIGNRFAYLSPAVLNVTGYAPEEIIGQPNLLWRMIHPDWRARVTGQWEEQIRGEGPLIHEYEFPLNHRNGQERWLRMRSLLVRDAKGLPMSLEGIATDVSERKQVERALAQGRRMLESTLAGLPAAVMVIDQDHLVAHWNQAMARLTGVPPEQVVGTNRQWYPFYSEPRPVMADLLVDQDWKGMQRQYGELGLKNSVLVEDGLEAETFFPNLNGQPRHLYFLAAPVKDDQGRVVRAVETLVDLTEKRRLEDELVRLSITDELTGLYNQRFFYATLSREIEAAKRYGQSLCLLMLDLDRFKLFNDTYGHIEGDRVLKACGQDLRNQVRTTDLACRYGGEEFVVLLPRTFLEEACRVSERVRLGAKALVFNPTPPGGGHPVSAGITVSVGVAEYRSGLSAEDLVRRADQALYTAKGAGRDRVAVYRVGGKVEVLTPEAEASPA